MITVFLFELGGKNLGKKTRTIWDAFPWRGKFWGHPDYRESFEMQKNAKSNRWIINLKTPPRSCAAPCAWISNVVGPSSNPKHAPSWRMPHGKSRATRRVCSPNRSLGFFPKRCCWPIGRWKSIVMKQGNQGNSHVEKNPILTDSRFGCPGTEVSN